MIYDVQGAPLYVYTGGKTFDPTKPTAVFIHGVLNDHSVWILQTRYFANLSLIHISEPTRPY